MSIERSGNITTLPSDHPIRVKVGRALELFPLLDKAEDHVVNRSGVDYLRIFGGLEQFFSYVEGLGSGSLVLDVGAGTTRGIFHLSHFARNTGLRFEATVLERLKGSNEYIGQDQVHFTSVEYLEGIADNSVGGMLGLASIAYSAAPDFAIRRIDEVLVPGGVLKATFKRHDPQPHMQRHDEFSQELRRLGYDVGIDGFYDHNILLAIKPGNNQKTTARTLLDLDRETFMNQIQVMKATGVVLKEALAI